MKDHLSQHKKIYGLAALTLVFGTIFSESVFADGEGASEFETLYTDGLDWFKKIGKLGLLGISIITLGTAMKTQSVITTGMACVVSIAVIKVCGLVATMLNLSF